jgi:UDP:flavonoid glycosyltransferase YjiC (YdhE family)
MNSVNESLYYKVPMVLFPYHSEQKMVAQRVYDLGAGTMLNKNTIDNIKNSTLEVLYNNNYKENAIKNGKSVCRAVSRFTKEGNYLDSFESARDAARQLSLTSNHITECCNKKRKSSNGFIWRYEGGNDLSDCQ